MQRLELLRYLRKQGVWDTDDQANKWLNKWPEFLYDFQFKILVDDDQVFIINKPFFVRVDIPYRDGQYKRKWDTELSAADVYIQHNPLAKQVYLCHQLDYATSGILVFAKTQKVARAISLAFAGRKVKKIYSAVVCGRVRDPDIKALTSDYDDGIIRFYCDEDPPFKMKVVDIGKECQLTASIRRYGKLGEDDVTELELRPISGRRHQLRLFCTFVLRHPILGDTTYYSEEKYTEFYRMCLHAESLDIVSRARSVNCKAYCHWDARIKWMASQ